MRIKSGGYIKIMSNVKTIIAEITGHTFKEPGELVQGQSLGLASTRHWV